MLNKILSFAKIQPIPDIYHKYVWIGLGLITLVAAKLYFRGTQCKVKRDLSGKVAIVTGGNTGIGKETVVGLIKENCLVIIGARDEAKTNATITEIKKQYPNSKLYGYRLDLGDRESIREFSSKVFDKV